MALGSWGTSVFCSSSPHSARHKCLSALGSWGTQDRLGGHARRRSHKCLSALGSWGTADIRQQACRPPRVTNASRHWVLGEQGANVGIHDADYRVTNASRHWVLGEPPSPRCNNRENRKPSQMPLGIGFLGNPAQVQQRLQSQSLGHKCLSALGSWGTESESENLGRRSCVTNASRHWVLGEPKNALEVNNRSSSHKCLSALGSWGTNTLAELVGLLSQGHKCLSALGSWGTVSM